MSISQGKIRSFLVVLQPKTTIFLANFQGIRLPKAARGPNEPHHSQFGKGGEED
jgi:hypothetical protein